MKHLDSEIIINCSGLSSSELFGESQTEVYLGHTVLIPQHIDLSENGWPVSYNYEPREDLYPSAMGIKQDVYSYSRSGELLLGGSRIPGNIIGGRFISETHAIEMAETDAVAVPAPLLKLNTAIFKHYFGIDLDAFPQKIGRSAYRYIRNTQTGLRIEAEEKGEKLLLHNYGNGGAGVTISWGAALKVFNLLARRSNQDMISAEDVILRLRTHRNF